MPRTKTSDNPDARQLHAIKILHDEWTKARTALVIAKEVAADAKKLFEGIDERLHVAIAEDESPLLDGNGRVGP